MAPPPRLMRVSAASPWPGALSVPGASGHHAVAFLADAVRQAPPPALPWLLNGLWERRGIDLSVREHPTTARKLGSRSPEFALHIVLVMPAHLL
jgi:hypothetical protein